MSVSIEIRNRHFKLNGGKPWYEMTHKGTTYQLDNSFIELFEIKILAAAIGRTSRQVWLWEKEKKIPKPLIVVEGSRCKRWYSAAQIVNCNRIFKYRYFGHKTLHDRAPEFFKDINSIWFTNDVVVTTDGLINGR